MDRVLLMSLIVILIGIAILLKMKTRECFEIEGGVKSVIPEPFGNAWVTTFHVVDLEDREHFFWIDGEYFGDPSEGDFGKITYRRKYLGKIRGREYQLKFAGFQRTKPFVERELALKAG